LGAVDRRREFSVSLRAQRPFFAASAFKSSWPMSKKKPVIAENAKKSRRERREKTELLKIDLTKTNPDESGD
jgi:hypothetical protein